MSVEHIKTKRFVKAWQKSVGELQLDHQLFSRELIRRLSEGVPCALSDFENEQRKARRLKSLVKKRPSVHFNEEHKIDGHGGLTLKKTPFCLSFVSDSLKMGLFAESAFHALSVPVLLNQRCFVTGKCSVTQEEISLTVSALGLETLHEQLFVSFYHPDELDAKLCGSVAQWSKFILGDGPAEEYLSDNADHVLVPISQSYQIARECTKSLYGEILA